MRGIVLAIFLLTGLPGLGQQQQPADDQTTTSSTETTPAKSDPNARSSEETPAMPRSPVPDLTPGPDGKLSQEQMQQLFRVVADKDLENDKRQRDYTYIERQVKNKLDGKGNTKST